MSDDIYLRAAGMNVVKDKDNIYFVLVGKDAICEMNVNSKKTQILETFFSKDKVSSDSYLYKYIEKNGNILYLAPCEADSIAYYDLKNKTSGYIPLSTNERYSKKLVYSADKFIDVFSYGDDVFFIGRYYPGVLRVNSKTNEVTYIDDWIEDIADNEEIDMSMGLLSTGGCVIEEKAYIPCACCSKILCIDTKNNTTSFIDIESDMKAFVGMCRYDENHFFIVGRGRGAKYLLKWDIQNNKTIKFILPEVNDEIIELHTPPVKCGNKIFVLPYRPLAMKNLNTYCLDATNDDNKVKTVKELKEIVIGGKNLEFDFDSYVISLGTVNEKLFFVRETDLSWIEIETSNYDTKQYYSLISESDERIAEIEEEQIKRHINMSKPINENMIPLNYLLDYML